MVGCGSRGKRKALWRTFIIKTCYNLRRKKDLSSGSFATDPLFFQWGGGKGVSVAKPSPKVLGSKSSLVMQCEHWWHVRCYHYRWAFWYMINASCPASNSSCNSSWKIAIPHLIIWQNNPLSFAFHWSVPCLIVDWNFALLRWHHSPAEDDVIISPLNTEVKEEDKKCCQKCIGWHVQLPANDYNTQELCWYRKQNPKAKAVKPARSSGRQIQSKSSSTVKIGNRLK